MPAIDSITIAILNDKSGLCLLKPEKSEMEWITKPIGLNRNELINPQKVPLLHPEKRWEVTTYNEVWKLNTENIFLKYPNESSKRNFS